MGNYTIFWMFENPRRDGQAINFTTNVPKILDLKLRFPNRYFPKVDVGCLWTYLSTQSETPHSAMQQSVPIHRHLCPLGSIALFLNSGALNSERATRVLLFFLRSFYWSVYSQNVLQTCQQKLQT